MSIKKSVRGRGCNCFEQGILKIWLQSSLSLYSDFPFFLTVNSKFHSCSWNAPGDWGTGLYNIQEKGHFAYRAFVISNYADGRPQIFWSNAASSKKKNIFFKVVCELKKKKETNFFKKWDLHLISWYGHCEKSLCLTYRLSRIWPRYFKLASVSHQRSLWAGAGTDQCLTCLHCFVIRQGAFSSRIWFKCQMN